MSWNDIGKQATTSTSDMLLDLAGQTRFRLLLVGQRVDGEPDTYRMYSMSAPDGGYRTWLAPTTDDFFAINRNAFGIRTTHAGTVYDYTTGAIKILEAGNQVWEEIAKVRNAGMDIFGRDFMITKTGTGRDTSYSVIYLDPSPMPNWQGLPVPNVPEFYGEAPSYDSVINDLRSMGFTNPEDLFTPRQVTYDQAKEFKMPFGKNKDKTMIEVFNTDSQYLSFLSEKVDRIDVKQMARIVSNQLLGTSYEVDGVCPSVAEVDFQSSQQQATPAAAPQVYKDPTSGAVYHLINNEWVLQPATPPTPPTPPAPPVPPVPTPATPPVPNTPPAQPAGNWNAQPSAPATPPNTPPVPPVASQPTGLPPHLAGNQAAETPTGAPTGVPNMESPFNPSQAPAGTTPPPPFAPPTGAPTPAPAVPTEAPAAGNVEALKAQVNQLLETIPKYKDFTQIVSAMQLATNGAKVNINEFTEQELNNLIGILQS